MCEFKLCFSEIEIRDYLERNGFFIKTVFCTKKSYYQINNVAFKENNPFELCDIAINSQNPTEIIMNDSIDDYYENVDRLYGINNVFLKHFKTMLLSL